MTLGYLPENGDFVVFLRLTKNSAYLYTSQRREKDEQHILKIFSNFHENIRVFNGVMTLALSAFSVFLRVFTGKE